MPRVAVSLTLSSAEQRHLSTLQAAMLSPLVCSDSAAWRDHIDAALRQCFNCDHAMFVLPDDTRVNFLSPSVDPGVLRTFGELTSRDPDSGQFIAHDPVVETWFQARRADRLEAFTESVNDQMLRRFGHDLNVSEIANTVWRGGMLDFFGLMTDEAQCEMMLITGYERRGRMPLTAEALRERLALLVPAFRAGHSSLVRMNAHRADLVRTLDFLSDAVMLCDLTGRDLHRNTALRTLVDGDPDAEQQVIAVCRRLAIAVARFAVGTAPRRPPSGPTAPLEVSPEQVVRTRTARYRIVAVPAARTVFGVEGVLLSVSVLPRSDTPTPVPQREYGLTAREHEVAEHLARGLSNAELAEVLGVSVFTARNHTERVLRKLGVSRRSGVGAVLRG